MASWNEIGHVGIDYLSELYSGSYVVVKVSGSQLGRETIQEVIDQLHDMDELLTYTGGKLAVVHGAGAQLDSKLKKKNLDFGKMNGLRVSNAYNIHVIMDEMQIITYQVATALRDLGTPAKPMLKGFKAESMGEDYGGHVGRPYSIGAELEELLAHPVGHVVPILTSIGIDDSGQCYNINADDATVAVVAKVKPSLLIDVTATNGVLGPDGEVETIFSLEKSVEYVTDGMAVKVDAFKRALDYSPNTRIVVTGPSDMVQSLGNTSSTTIIR